MAKKQEYVTVSLRLTKDVHAAYQRVAIAAEVPLEKVILVVLLLGREKLRADR